MKKLLKEIDEFTQQLVDRKISEGEAIGKALSIRNRFILAVTPENANESTTHAIQIKLGQFEKLIEDVLYLQSAQVDNQDIMRSVERLREFSAKGEKKMEKLLKEIDELVLQIRNKKIGRNREVFKRLVSIRDRFLSLIDPENVNEPVVHAIEVKLGQVESLVKEIRYIQVPEEDEEYRRVKRGLEEARKMLKEIKAAQDKEITNFSQKLDKIAKETLEEKVDLKQILERLIALRGKIILSLTPEADASARMILEKLKQVDDLYHDSLRLHYLKEGTKMREEIQKREQTLERKSGRGIMKRLFGRKDKV